MATSPLRPALLATLTLVLAAVLAAQDGGEGGGKADGSGDEEPVRPWSRLDAHTTAASRAAFRACDGDGNDRLDVLEAGHSLPGIERGELRSFQALDRNRDGYLEWPEFDAHCRALLGRQGVFHFRPVRPFEAPGGAAAAAPGGRPALAMAAVEFALSLSRLDDDPAMSKAEFARLLEVLRRSPGEVALFSVLDGDGSGSLSAGELLPVVQHVPYLMELARRQPVIERSAPGGGEEGTSAAERRQRLARMHPTLARWQWVLVPEVDEAPPGPEPERGGEAGSDAAEKPGRR